ncbi:hypothetical protein GBAR_LOCUS10848 [Geodia barretti]|nr:hypothetical protein GBAR_LOCUS10848 [Geodia barretti]
MIAADLTPEMVAKAAELAQEKSPKKRRFFRCRRGVLTLCGWLVRFGDVPDCPASFPRCPCLLARGASGFTDRWALLYGGFCLA